MTYDIYKADAIEFLKSQSEGSLDLVFGSPPYEQARLCLEDGVDIGISKPTDDWVAWMVEVYKAAQAACKGLVAFVVAGQTRKYRWSAGPALLMADLHRAGMNLRNPPIFSRVGIPGSGGPDWLRSDYEWIICTTRPGRLPWSDNTACGHPPKWLPGGEMSYRLFDGTRRSAKEKLSMGAKPHTKRDAGLQSDGAAMRNQAYLPPTLANPGNIVHCKVGGGRMGSVLAHGNESPFPEKLAELFVRSFCPPGGICCDPFSGSGTTAAVAKRSGRNFIGCDIRQSQVDLTLRRLAELEAAA